MSSYQDFIKRIYGWREVGVLVGDTLDGIALRELGDANRWTELVSLNELRAPYIVATVAERVAQPWTLAYGDQIKIPNQLRRTVAVQDYADIYGIDVGLWDRGALRVSDGDISVRSGLDNLSQALRHRVSTEPGEIRRHPHYGCHARAVLGEKHTPVIRLLAQAFVVEAVNAEPRIERLDRADIVSNGDAIELDLVVNPINGERPVEANLVFVRVK